MRSTLTLAAVLVAGQAAAAPLCGDLGPAGLPAKCNRGEPIRLTLAAGAPLAAGPVTLQSGAYYEIGIAADGSAELALAGPEFFRAIWMNEVVTSDIEVRPMAIDSFEFDDEGAATPSFVAVEPGSYRPGVPGGGGDQTVTVTIE